MGQSSGSTTAFSPSDMACQLLATLARRWSADDVLFDAARAGVADMVVLTPEQREELMLVETQIKQKLAIGATASKRHLVEDLGRLGVNEWAVMRALMIMSQRGEIQERAEGRRVTRVH